MANPTAVNIGIGFDMSVLKQSVAAARSEISSFVRDTKRAQTDLERFNQKKGVVDALFGAKEISPQLHAKMVQYYKDLYNIEQGHNKAAAAAKRHSQASGGGFLNRNLGQFGTGVMAGLGVASVASIASQAGQAIGDFLADSIKIAMERQRIGAAMEALLGSDQAAERMTSAMRKLDRQSMLTFGTISKGAQTLLGFGVSQEMVMPSLDALSKISMGNAERFQSLALAFGQVAASGKLAGQEILQMVNAGFNPLQEISRVTGRTMSDLKRDVEEGHVSFLQVAEAIITATEAGGRFEKISEKMLSTPAGMLAKLQSDFDMIKAEIGEQLMPAMITLLSTIADNKGLVQDVGLAFAYLFNTMADGIAIIEDFRNWTDFSQAPDPKAQAAALQRRAEAEARQKKRDAERAKEEKEKSDFNKLPEAERKERLLAQAAQMDMARITKESWKALQDQKDDLHKMLYTEEEILRMRLEINEDTRKSIEENYKKLEGTIKQKESLASGIASRNKEIEDISATIDPFEAVKKQRDLYEKNYLSSLKEIREKEKQLASLPPVAGAGFGRDMLRLEGEIAKLKEKAKLSKKQYDDINQEIATGMHGHMDDAAKEKRDRLREELKKLEEDLQKIMNDVPESLLNGAKNAYDQLREQQSAAEDAIRTAQAEAGIKSLDEIKPLADKLKFVGDMVADDLLSIEEGSRLAERLRNEDKKEQAKRREEWQEFGQSLSPEKEAISRVRDIMLAVEYGFLDAAEAAKAQLEAVKDLDKENQLSLENPKLMDLGQALLENQRAQKAESNEKVMKDKLVEIAKLAQQQVDILKNQPGFAERN